MGLWMGVDAVYLFLQILYSLVVVSAIVAALNPMVTIDISFIYLVPLFFVVFVAWNESEFHFYRDYSYTFLLMLMPEIIMDLCLYIWQYMQFVLHATIWYSYGVASQWVQYHVADLLAVDFQHYHHWSVAHH